MYIERLSGKLVASVATGIILDVNGVGYGLEIPLSLMSQLPALGDNMDVWTYSYIKRIVFVYLVLKVIRTDTHSRF